MLIRWGPETTPLPLPRVVLGILTVPKAEVIAVVCAPDHTIRGAFKQRNTYYFLTSTSFILAMQAVLQSHFS